MAKNPLYIYLAMSEHAISAALLRQENGTQLPVYYVSKSLVNVETRYPAMEKLVYTLIFNSKKLIPYFHAHHTYVLKDQPIGKFNKSLKPWVDSLSGLLS